MTEKSFIRTLVKSVHKARPILMPSRCIRIPNQRLKIRPRARDPHLKSLILCRREPLMTTYFPITGLINTLVWDDHPVQPVKLSQKLKSYLSLREVESYQGTPALLNTAACLAMLS